MSQFLYQCGMNVFGLAMRIFGWFNLKARLGTAGRKGLIEKLESSFPTLAKGRPVAWFHAASLGEFEQGRPVIDRFRKDYPHFFIVLTFFSASGYEIRKNYAGADYICYLPFDTSANARRFVAILKPEVVFFIKYEFWFNYLRELRRNGSYILSFSAIFRPDQIFFKPHGGFYRRLLTYFDHIFVQNESSQSLLAGIGISKVSVGGDTRFDRVREIADLSRQLPEIEKFVNGLPCLVAGSVWEADMQILIPVLKDLQFPLKAIIAPHEIKKDQMEQWIQALDGKAVLYSEYIKNVDNQSSTDVYDYLIIDNVGMLSSLYRYGAMAYIGGAFGSGLHNILEAATFGLPILFGNRNYLKFQEAVDLIAAGGAHAIENTAEVAELLGRWVGSPEEKSISGAVNKNYVASRIGATQMIMENLQQNLRQH